MVNARDHKKTLFIFHREAFKLASGLFFMLIFYTDKARRHIKMTIKEVMTKTTVINLKEIRLEDFND